MRGRTRDGLIPGQAVDAHIKEAACCQTQQAEKERQDYFHGRLLWTYCELKSIVATMKSKSWPGAASPVIAIPNLQGRSDLLGEYGYVFGMIIW